MKTCATCKRMLHVTEFYYAGYTKNGKRRLTNECKICRQKREMDRYYEQVDAINAFKTECIICGEDRKYLIEFHHRDPSEKEFVIAHWRKKSKEALCRELKKCDPLCKNCHAEYHFLNAHFDLSYADYISLMSCSLPDGTKCS